MQKIFFLLFTFIVALSYSQNSIITYDFGSTPQALMLNPSYDIDAQYHVTIPLLGSHKISLESSGINVYDLFAKNSIPFDEKVKNTIYKLKPTDYVLGNQKMEIFNVGQRIKTDYYLSYGAYLETDIYSTIPSELLKLFYEGTSNSGKKYKLDGIAIQVNLLTVYHIGLQTKLNKKTNIGGRLKLYNNMLELYSSSNKGSFETNFSDNASHTHNISGVDFTVKTSGIPVLLDENFKPIVKKFEVINDDGSSEIIKDYVLIINGKEKRLTKYITEGHILKQVLPTGIGIDLGFTYKIRRNLTTSVSINDLGFIYHKSLAQTYNYKGDYTTDAITFEYDPSTATSYSDMLINDINEDIPLDVSNKGYLSLRPFQAHASLVYAFGVNRGNKCNYYRNIENSAANKMGALLYAQYRPGQIIYDANLFYERNFSNKVYARINYTINSYSYANVGLSAATQLGKFNMFVGINNILSLSNLAKSNNLGIQFGINIVSKKRLR